MLFPEELKYTEDHEWARVEEDGSITIGITDFAQKELGDIVYIEVETEGDDLDKAEVFGSVEAVKTVSDLFMPISGTVLELNPALLDNPELVNTDPYGEGWLVKIKPSDEAQLTELMSAEAYAALVQ